MREKKWSFNGPRLLLVTLVGLALVGCPVDSPTAPEQTPIVVGGSSGAWSVTVTASPSSLVTDDAGGSTITISIRRADGSGPPPDGATAVLSTNLGNFLSLGGSDTSIIVELVGGLTQEPFFPGNLAGVAVIRAEIEQSSGETSIRISRPDDPPPPAALIFLESTPTSIAETGGTLNLVAVVRDDQGMGIPGVLVSFSAAVGVLDSRGGLVETDDSGSASDGLTVDPADLEVFTGESFEATAETDDEDGQPLSAVTTIRILRPTPLEITGIDPISGPYFGGTLVTVFGNGFETPMVLEFGGLQQDETVESGTRVTALSESITTSGCSDQTGSSSILLLETGEEASGPSFTYLVSEFGPVVEDVECTAGCSGTSITQAGGSTLELGGGNFRSSEVTVGGQSVNLVSSSTTRLRVLSPAFGDSFFDTETCAGSSDTGLVATAVTISVANGETTCSDSFAGSLLVEPTPDPGGKTCP